MKIEIDQNKLLVIVNENIPQTKEYTYQVSGYTFSDFDKGMIVLHKKDFKIVNLKNLGDGMSVIYHKEQKNHQIQLDNEALEMSFGLFNTFNETTGKTYFFIPNINEKTTPEKNQMLEKLHIKNKLQKTDKWTIIDGKPFSHTEKRLSLFFGLLLIYGKFDTKKGELSSIKIQLPLFGQYLKHAEILDKMIREIQDHGIFLKADKLTNNNGITYQISSNDYELLEIFAKWYEPIEKFSKISKRDFTDEMKKKLVEFLEANPEIPANGKVDVIKKIKSGTIKFLVKS